MTLESLYTGLGCSIKNKTYFETKKYVEPFINKFQKEDININCVAKSSLQLPIINNNTTDIFNKVCITCINKNSEFEINKIPFYRFVTFAYGLDIKCPSYKFYSGVTTNDTMFVFGNTLNSGKIESETAFDYTLCDKTIQQANSDNCQKMLEQIFRLSVAQTQLTDQLGLWIKKSLLLSLITEGNKIKLTKTLPIDVYEKLNDVDSPYYVQGNEIPLFNILSQFSDLINTDKDIINRYEKLQLVNSVLGL